MKTNVPLLEIYPNHAAKVIRESAIRKLLYQIVPRHVAIPVAYELRAAYKRVMGRTVKRRYEHATDLLVNVGAGEEGRPGWVNIDLQALPGINCFYDCRKGLPFPDRSVRAIFCEHFFEHLDYTDEVPYFLSDCHRVLIPGGVIRIIVPDGERYLQAYCQPGWESLAKLRPLGPDRADSYGFSYHTKMELVNVVFRQGHEHKFAYDYETLELLLHKYGFATVVRQAFGRSQLPELCIDLPTRACESLYVEAQKAKAGKNGI
jgi:predicted SAM-dependent methyltransferase